MNQKSLVRRLVGIAGAGALALTPLALVAAPATAAPFAGQLQKQTTFSATGTGCSVSPGTTSPTTNFVAGAPVSLAQSESTNGVGPTGPDTAQLSAALGGSFVAHESGGALTDFSADATAATSVNRALGAASACTWNSTAIALVTGTLTSNGGLWDVNVKLFGSGTGVVQLIFIKTGNPLASQNVVAHIGGAARTHTLVSLAPGDYTLQVVVEAVSSGTNTANQPTPTSNAHAIVNGVFRGFGVADGPATGDGTKYLDLANGLTCASHSLKADFKKKAGKKAKKGKKPVITKAVFFVNDAKVKTVKKPNKNTTVTLSGLPDTDTLDVSAQLTLSGKGKGKVTVERSYLPCS
ncbi:MAG TPA: hypothetical protein VFV89_11240 [Nocardioides sp.]|uniref:hypothetical protein n=1 Tax=Nocardioides sp. TaxID=35761 RepID=UPI002E347828|nr:hypothetical protein [Nocardioides sp.]HEX5088373.1 hypothetical protein [Nocardioides sp.]